MKLIDSRVAPQILKHAVTDTANLHFFSEIAVVEFNDGVHVDLASAQNTIDEILHYFGCSKPFGIVANRVNSYSISLLDAVEMKPKLPNLVAYGVISYNIAGRMNAIIEDNLCENYNVSYTNLYEGLDAVHQRVKGFTSISLN